MRRKTDLLIEIGLEELPHSFIEDAVRGFRDRFTGLLSGQKVQFGRVREFSTPRRIALHIQEVSERQDDYFEEKRGPSVEASYLPNGFPSKAIEGFLKAHNITVDDIVTKTLDNKEYVFLLREIKGKATFGLLPEVLDQTLKSISFPKNMRWERSGFQFIRPIRWILYLFGNKLVPYSIADISSSNFTYGHRSYHQDPIVISKAGEYEEKLGAYCVIPDRERRKMEVEEQVDSICNQQGLQVPEIARALYDNNTDLTEFPHAVLCEYDSSFLELPIEVLTSEMIEHQYYFPLIKADSGALSPFFIVISNIKKNEKSIPGYQKVLHARLDDGRFFYNEDKKRDFATYGEKLRTVTFHEELGSMHQKVEHISTICDILSDQLGLGSKEKESVLMTARLCKNDLVTLMVGEFPALQGIMGYYYAQESGYPEEVALGIKEHYYPRFAGDILPSHIEGTIVGIADRLDTILGIFSIGAKPSGSKDPFALRRKVFGVVRILIAQELNFSMRGLIEEVSGLYTNSSKKSALMDDVHGFFIERIRSIFSDMGFAYDEINASLEGVMDDIYEAYRRLDALHRYRSRRDFEDLLTSFKRMSNILKDYILQDNILKDEEASSFSEDLLTEHEEKELYRYFMSVKARIVENIRTKDYDNVYSILSTFKPYVDGFFDNVLVMDEDLKLRANRIGLLNIIINVFFDIIDISKIVSD